MIPGQAKNLQNQMRQYMDNVLSKCDTNSEPDMICIAIGGIFPRSRGPMLKDNRMDGKIKFLMIL